MDGTNKLQGVVYEGGGEFVNMMRVMSNLGFVSLIISTEYRENDATRLSQHNQDIGAEGTACTDYLFPAVAQTWLI